MRVYTDDTGRRYVHNREAVNHLLRRNGLFPIRWGKMADTSQDCRKFCEQCGDCLECYADEHVNGCQLGVER